jgi:leucyl aminopeptidase
MINMPANHLNPQGMEDEARRLAGKFGAKIKVTVGDTLARNFPAIHTVGRAAESPPRLIDLTWGDKGPAITLVGKGVTFDSGGLDIKPSSAMEMMKKDMGGAAIVLGLARTIMGLRLRVQLRVLIPVAENAISDKSMRPLDVIETAAGIPVEVGNTDAEGRLILADALYLATSGDEKPDMLIDFATLTGAARIAVGTELPAVFSNDDDLSEAFVAAGKKAGDPLWPLPLHAPYDRYLDGGHAALSSTGSSRYGGAITAALFLQRFLASPVPWAHVDVMGWNLTSRPGHPKGGEAMGLRAALRMIEDRLADQ